MTTHTTLETAQRLTQDERRNARRQAILDAAEALFLEQGFPAVSLNAIVQRSGGSLATIYQMFGSKQGLLRAVVEQNCAADLQEIERLFRSKASARHILEEVAYRYHAFIIRPHTTALTRLVIAESLNDPEFGRFVDQDIRAKYTTHVAAIFTEWNAAGRMKTDQPEETADLFFAMALCNEPMRALLTAMHKSVSRERMAWRLAPFLDYFAVEG